jgi:hypothetical protein
MPLTAFVLGWAGVLPFVGLVGLKWSDVAITGLDTGVALLSYGAVILSFMAAVHWGRATILPHSPLPFLISVAPALAAWACLVIGGRTGVVGLIFGFVGLLAYDLSVVHAGGVPQWYARLRIQLTLPVVLSLALALGLM